MSGFHDSGKQEEDRRRNDDRPIQASRPFRLHACMGLPLQGGKKMRESENAEKSARSRCNACNLMARGILWK